jgi:hypothetical protein
LPAGFDWLKWLMVHWSWPFLGPFLGFAMRGNLPQRVVLGRTGELQGHRV